MAAPPELQQLLAQSRDRTAYQNPLFQAVTQMAYRGLPVYAREGTQLSGTLSNQAPAVAPQSGGGMSPLTSGILGGLGGAALNSLGPNGNLLGAAIDGLKKLFGHRDQGVQGNRPYGGGAQTGPGMSQNLPNDALMFPFGYDWTGPQDPSQGTGVGPGMQRYYDWLATQGGGEDSSDQYSNPEDWWGNE